MTALPLLACVLLTAALAICASAIASKSLFALAMRLAAGASLAAAALVALGASEAALVAALVFAIAWPLVLLAVSLLSARAVKAAPNRLSWLASGAAACAVAAIAFSVLPELSVVASRATASAPQLPLMLLVFVSSTASVALLGYGERGEFNHRAQRSGDDRH
jgi:hypothetical protein